MHLKRLKDGEIVRIRYGERRHLYTIANKEEVAEVIAKYKQDYMENAIDNYLNFVDEI